MSRKLPDVSSRMKLNGSYVKTINVCYTAGDGRGVKHPRPPSSTPTVRNEERCDLCEWSCAPRVQGSSSWSLSSLRENGKKIKSLQVVTFDDNAHTKQSVYRRGSVLLLSLQRYVQLSSMRMTCENFPESNYDSQIFQWTFTCHITQLRQPEKIMGWTILFHYLETITGNVGKMHNACICL